MEGRRIDAATTGTRMDIVIITGMDTVTISIIIIIIIGKRSTKCIVY